MKFTKLPSLLFLIIFFVASCGTPPSSQGGNNPNADIEIQITDIEPIELGTDTISQPNCTGTAEVENTIEKSRTIQYVVEVQNGVSVNANGQVGFAGTNVELGATVASQLGQSYGTSETLTRSITVKAKPETSMQHAIRQIEIWKIGQATISVGGQQTIIPFKFRSDFTIELVNSQNIYPNGCDNLPSPTQIPALPSTPTAKPIYQEPNENWTLGKLIYEENFESGTINNIKTTYGFFDIVQMTDGNHAWQTTATGGSEITLPTTSNDYAVETKIMQVSGQKGFGTIEIRRMDEKPCRLGYYTYLDGYGDWLNLVEFGFTGSTCDEIRQTGLFANYKTSLSNGTWYTVRMEAKGAEIRVYLDGKLVAHDKDIDGMIPESNKISIWTCCGDSEPFTFNFDDIKVWLVNP